MYFRNGGRGAAGALVGLAAVLATPANAQEQESAQPLEEVTVFARDQTEQSLQVPQSVDVLNAALIEDSGSKTVGDALRFVPGASRDGSPLDAFGDTYLMRGFYSSQTVNGIGANRLNHARDSVQVERIEVLKGPASVLYGQLQPGAVVNVVTKQPERSWAFKGAAEGARFDQYRATADVTGPLTDSQDLRFRAIGAYDDAGSFVDNWHKDHLFLSTALAYDFSERTSLIVEGFVSDTHWDAFHNGIPAEGTVLPNPNGRIPRGRSIADTSWDGVDRSNTDITVRLHHRFSDSISYRGAASWTREHADGEEIFGVLGWEDESQRNLTRALLKSDTEGDAYLLYNDLNIDFSTADIAHQLTLGADLTRFERVNANDIGLTTSLDMFDPVYSSGSKPEVLSLPDFSGVTDEEAETYGVFVQDRIKWSERWQTVAGVRYAGFDQTVEDRPRAAEASTSEQSPTELTTQLGVVYQPRPALAFFANRSTSFLPVQGTTTDGQSLDPETGTQYELGVKAALLQNRVTATLALFELTRGDVAVSDRDDPSALIPIGEQRARGVEASVRGRLAPGWAAYFAYGYTDAETTEDTNAALVGKPIRNVPQNTLALESDYRIGSGVLAGLTVGGIVNYVDQRAGDIEGSFVLPDYWRVDLFGNYWLGQHWNLRAAIENLFDETYYDHAFSLYEVWPGAPRTLSLRLSFQY